MTNISRSYLLSSLSNVFRHGEERQQALLDMINVGGLQHFDLDVLVDCCTRVGFYKILETLYEKNGEYDKILGCYLLDTARHVQTFSFLQNIFLDDRYNTEVRVAVKNQITGFQNSAD